MRFVEDDELASDLAFRGREDVGIITGIIGRRPRSRPKALDSSTNIRTPDNSAEAVSGRENAPERQQDDAAPRRKRTVWFY